MALTTPDSIYYPDSTTQISPLETQFATMASSIQTALATGATSGGILPHKVISSAARDSLYPYPVQGNMVFRNDTGNLEMYFALYNLTNPGGKTTAGWYVVNTQDKLEVGGIVAGASPVIKTGYAQVSFTSGSGTLVLPTAFSTKCVSINLTVQYTAALYVQVNLAAATVLPLQNIPLLISGSSTGTFGIHYTATGY
jgi:hypothetical protein